MGNVTLRIATPTENKTIETLQQLISTPYSEELHLNLLQRLWKAAGLESDFSRTSNEWKKLGFQRDDPVSDIRGGGVLALTNLVAFLEEDSEAREMLDVRKRREKDGENYPWAAAGINITRMLCEVLEVIKQTGAKSEAYRSKERAFWHLCSSLETFNLLYAFTFKLLDEIWTREKATYMEFPRVLHLTKARIYHIVTSEQTLLPRRLREDHPGNASATLKHDDDDADYATPLPSVDEWGPGVVASSGHASSPIKTNTTTTVISSPPSSIKKAWRDDRTGGVDDRNSNNRAAGHNLLGFLSQPMDDDVMRRADPAPVHHYSEAVIKERSPGGSITSTTSHLSHRRRTSQQER